MVGTRIPCFILYWSFFFFFFWINRLCTLNSQKPSLELQSPKFQGFNFNWFSCCEYNPYPPLWTFFFFFFCMTYVNTKISVFFFFFFFQLLWHPIRFLSQHPKVHEKNPTTHHKPVLWFFFFFQYRNQLSLYSTGSRLLPHPTLAFILTKNQQLLVHAPRCWYSSHIYSTSLQLSWFFNFFFFTPLNPITYTQQCRFSKWVWTRSRSTMPSWRWLNSSLSRLPRFLTSKCWLGLRASPPGFLSFFLSFFLLLLLPFFSCGYLYCLGLKSSWRNYWLLGSSGL